jgi:Fervidolysin N-terminal prodomain
MRCASTIQLLVILIISTSCGTQHQEAQDKLQPHPQAIEIQGNNQPKLSPAGGETKSYVPGEILVKFRDGTTDQTKESTQKEVHLETIRIVSKPNLYLLKILDGSSVESVIERLGKFKEVNYAEPNYIRTIH